MFLELEEKRLKFEEQQKHEEREFQLKMVQMLQGGMGEAACTSTVSRTTTYYTI